MNNLIVFPMVLPLIIGVLLVFFPAYIKLQRIVTILTLIANSIIAFIILQNVLTDVIASLHFGGWLPPFGVSFVADCFSTLLVLSIILVMVLCVFFDFYSIGGYSE